MAKIQNFETGLICHPSPFLLGVMVKKTWGHFFWDTLYKYILHIHTHGQVGHEDCDLGVTAISYNYKRGSFIDYTFQVGLDGTIWVSQPPQLLPPIRNISLIFDTPSWLFIIGSVILVTLTLVIIARLNLTGVGSGDVVFVCVRKIDLYSNHDFFTYCF